MDTARVRNALSTMSACLENADDSTINANKMDYLQAFQSTLDRIWISCIVYPNEDEGEGITPNSSFCNLMIEAVDKFYSGHVHHPTREVLTGLHNALRIIATSSHSFPPLDEHLTSVCMKIYEYCVEILFDKAWVNVEDESRASATKEFYNFFCCLSNWSHDRFLILAILSQKPWGHEIMTQVLEREENTDKAEVDRYLTLEGKYLLEHRLRVLIQEDLPLHALNLARACTEHPDLGQESIFLETLYLLYFKLGLTYDLQTQVEDHPTIQDVMDVAKSMSSYCPEHASNLLKSIIDRLWSEKLSSDLLIGEAEELWIDSTLKVCSPDSDKFAECLEDLSTLTYDPLYMYNLADLVYKKVGEAATVPLVSLCLKALMVPSLSVTEDIIQAAKLDYGNAAFCMLLSEILKNDERMQRLCLLAAFFIAPSLDSLSALQDSYQDSKEERFPKLTSYQQHDLIKCMEFFIPVCVSLSEDWTLVSHIFEGYFRKSKVICIMLSIPFGDMKTLKFYDKSWHPVQADFKPSGMLRVKEAFYSALRLHKGVVMVSCKHERQIAPKAKKKPSVENRNPQDCPASSETTAVVDDEAPSETTAVVDDEAPSETTAVVDDEASSETTAGVDDEPSAAVDDEASAEWLPCMVLDLQEEVLTEQEFIDHASDTPVEDMLVEPSRESPVPQSPPPLLDMSSVSLQSRILDSADASLVEERTDLQQEKSLEVTDNNGMVYSSREQQTKSLNHESATLVFPSVDERERKLPIITQVKQLDKPQVGTKYVRLCINRSDLESDGVVVPELFATDPELSLGSPVSVDSSDSCDSSDTEMMSWTDEQDCSSNQSEEEDVLCSGDEEVCMLAGKEKEFQMLEVNTCQRNLSKDDELTKHSHEFENPESSALNVSNVVPCCTQDEAIDLARDISADRKSVVQSALTDVVKVVLVKHRQAEELLLRTQDSQSFIEEQHDFHYSSPVKERVENNEVETCSMSPAEGFNHQHRNVYLKTSVCSVKLTCFMKHRVKKQNLQNLELWRFSVKEGDKEKGEDAESLTSDVEFDVKSPEKSLTRFPVNKVHHVGKSTAEIQDKQNGIEGMQIFQAETCRETKGDRLASVFSENSIPWIDGQLDQEEQSENPVWAAITSFNEDKCLENVSCEEMTEERPMLDYEPQTYPVDEVRNLELPLLTLETEVNEAMLPTIKDSLQECEDSDIPLLLDCYEEESHENLTIDKYVNCEQERHEDLVYPQDIHELSRNVFGETVDQRTEDHIEKSSVQENEFNNEIEPFVYLPVEHIHFQEEQVHEKKSVCGINLPCDIDRITAEEDPHSAAGEWQCTQVLGKKESEDVTGSTACDMAIDLDVQEKPFDHLSLDKDCHKGMLEGNLDRQNYQVIDSLGNKLGEVGSEAISASIDGLVASEEQPEVNRQFLMTLESGTMLNHETKLRNAVEDSSNTRGHSAVEASQSLLEIEVVSIDSSSNNLEDPVMAETTSLHRDKFVEIVSSDELTKSTEYRAVEFPSHKAETQTCPMVEVMEVESPVLTQETKVIKDPVMVEKRERSQSSRRNVWTLLSSIQDSSKTIENSNILMLVDSSDEELHNGKIDEKATRYEHARIEDLTFIKDDHELTRKAIRAGIEQRIMSHRDGPSVLENECTCSRETEHFDSSPKEANPCQQRQTQFKKSICCVNLPCNMDRRNAKDNPLVQAEEWRCIPKTLESKRDSKSCTPEVESKLDPLDKTVSPPSHENFLDTSATKGDKDEQNNRQVCQNVPEELLGNRLPDGYREFRIPWVDGQVYPEKQQELYRQYLMPLESKTKPANCTSSDITGDPAMKAIQPLLQTPDVSIGCPSTKSAELSFPMTTSLHPHLSLENVPCDYMTKLDKVTKHSTVESHIQQNDVQSNHVDEFRDVALPVLTQETGINKQTVTAEESDTPRSMTRNEVPMHDPCNEDLICCKDDIDHLRKATGVIDKENTCSNEKTSVLENKSGNEIKLLVSSQMEDIEDTLLQQRKIHFKQSDSCVKIPCDMDKRHTKENAPAERWQCVSRNIESREDSNRCTCEVDIELKPRDKPQNHLSLDRASDTSTTEVNIDKQNNRQDCHKSCPIDPGVSPGDKITNACHELDIPWIDRQVDLEEQTEVQQYNIPLKNGVQPKDGTSMPFLGDTCLLLASGDASTHLTNPLDIVAPELSIQHSNTKTDGSVLAGMLSIKKDVPLENVCNATTKLTKDLAAETQEQECKPQQHLDENKELKLPVLLQEAETGQGQQIVEDGDRRDNTRNILKDVENLSIPKIPDDNGAVTHAIAVQGDTTSEKSEKTDKEPIGNVSNAMNGSVDQSTLDHVEKLSGSNKKTSCEQGPQLCPEAEVTHLQQEMPRNMNHDLVVQDPHALTKQCRLAMGNVLLNGDSESCVCDGQVDRHLQKCTKCLSIRKCTVSEDHAADNQGKIVERNNDPIERLCQREEREAMVSGELVIPCNDGEIIREAHPNEDGQHLMLQEISPNDGTVHNLNTEAKQVAAMEIFIKQESLDIDSCKGNSAESSGVKEEIDFLFMESRDKVEAGGVMEKPSFQNTLLQESVHETGTAVKNKGAMLKPVILHTVADSNEERCNRKATGDIGRPLKTFLSGNCKNEPLNNSPLFEKRDALYGVTYGKTSLKQPSMPKSFNQSASVTHFISKKAGKESSQKICPKTANKFISKKSLKATPSKQSCDGDQIVNKPLSIRRFASRKSGTDLSPQSESSKKCPVRVTNKFISKKSCEATPNQVKCDRVTRKTVVTSKASVHRSVKKTTSDNPLGFKACAHKELSHLPLPLKSTAIKRRSSSLRMPVKSSSFNAQKHSYSEASPPPKLMKMTSTCASPVNSSRNPQHKHSTTSRTSVRQETQRSCIAVRGVITRKQIKVDSRKKGK